jgi:2-succinyl-5-enolpyruvyl-6-hydroxy-3-cyclohexene-1-carboxylate synthase
MGNYYSNERDILELVSLLREHHIRYAVISPGSTNISFAQSLLYGPDFKVFSAVDERSAAYMACGIAAETGEPVVISCTGATAARNYVPALTEAFYRKLPVLAVTSSQHFGRVGQYIPQVTDRTNPMNDIFVKSVQIPVATREEDKWANNLKMNDAILELR